MSRHLTEHDELVSDVVACQLVIKQILDVIDVIAPDVRVIVEDLVGHRYEECWGNSKLFKDAAPAPAQTVVSH